MAKFGELDWSNLKKTDDYEHEPTALWAADKHGGGKEGVDPLNKSKPILAKGEIPKGQSNEEIAEYILRGTPSQPTDEEMFGHLVVTEEMAKKAEWEWENKQNNLIKALNEPVIPEEKQQIEWGDGCSFNDSLTEAERIKRNMFTDPNSN